MELSVSHLLAQPLALSNEESVKCDRVLVDSETGKILGLSAPKKFFPAMGLIFHENGGVSFSGEMENKCRGDNWQNYRVENRKGSFRGRVSELWLDQNALQILKIETTRKLWGLWEKKLVFALGDIFAVFPSKKLIVVEEETRVFQGERLKMPQLQQISRIGVSCKIEK